MIDFFRRGLDWKAMTVIGALVAAAIIVPLFANSPDSPFHVSQNTTLLLGKYLCYSLLALSVGLIWGYGGILSLGHGAFFALGGYAMGMYLMRQIGSRGVYGHPVLPDFMVFLNWDELPWFWYGFDQFWFAGIMVILAPGLLAFLFGWFAFRSRVTGVYLSIITQALTFALWQAFLLNNFGFGGNNGFTDFKGHSRRQHPGAGNARGAVRCFGDRTRNRLLDLPVGDRIEIRQGPRRHTRC